MFLIRDGHAAVLLLVFTQSWVFVSCENEKNDMEDLVKAIIRSMQSPPIDRIESVIPRSSESSCEQEIATVFAAVEARESWALQMVDASSKIQSGILKGNVRDLGMYDECIGVNGLHNGTNVQGQHCTVSFGTLSSSVCVPSSCNETDVVQLVDAVIQNMTGINGLNLNISGVSCVSVESEAFTTGEILTVCFFVAVGIFIVFCTICEFVKKCRPVGSPPFVHVLAKFSLYTNAMALLNTEASPQMMPAIQGIRFLSTCWVVLGHRYVTTLLKPMVNFVDILEWYNSWPAVYVQTSPFAVDTFFVISGFLMTYLYIKSTKSGKTTNFLMAYLHRYLRLTPCIAVLVLFTAVLLHRVANGPLWNTLLNFLVKPCRENWWVNLLYVQNFVGLDALCLPHTWYLAVDMQLFWISPIILYPLNRWPKFGLGILCFLLVGSVVTPGVVLAVNGYSNAVIRLNGASSNLLADFLYFYIPTYNRACAYFVGLLLGYDVASRKRHFTRLIASINWAMACICMLVCVLATKRIYNTTFDYNEVLETAFAVVLRPIWSVAIAWIIYACTQGYGGPVTRFLSLPIFLPLSRLSYCIYLVHMVLQLTRISAVQTSGRFSDFILLDDFWADIILSIAVAFVFSLFFESPVIVLEKILKNRHFERGPIRELKNDLEGGIDNEGMAQAS